jgi:PAS domain S-box-containing protein
MTPSPQRPLSGQWLAIAFLLLAAGIGALWYSAISAYETAVLRERGRELQAIAELKIEFIRFWVGERRSDSAVQVGRRFMAHALVPDAGRARSYNPSEVLGQLEAIRQANDYEAVTLQDLQGNVRLGAGALETIGYAGAAGSAPNSIKSGRTVFSQARRTTVGKGAHTEIDIATPVIDNERPGSPIVGALVFHLDPKAHLDPFLSRWPAPSESGETFLVERTNGELTYLSSLRHAEAEKLTRHTGEFNLPAAMAARGGRGITEGIDYRGVPVLAAVGQVPDMPWFVIAKLDREEILAPVRREALWSGTLASLLVMALGLAMLAWHRRGQSELALARQSAAQAALAASEARFRKLHEHGSDINLLFDRNMVIRYASRSADRYLGRPAVGETIASGTAKVHPDDVASVEAARQVALGRPGQPQHVRHRFLNKEGGDWTVEASFTNLFDDPEVGGLSYEARDVSELARAQAFLRESEERYRFLFDNGPLPMWVYDTDTLAFLEVNQTAIAQYGYTRKEFLGMTLRDIRPPEDLPALDAALAGQDRPGGRVWTHRRKDGSLIKVAIWSQDTPLHGRPARMVLAENVTARVEAELALAESEARLRAIFDSAPVGIAIADGEGRYLMVNRAQCEMLGYSEAELLQRSFSDITHPEDVQANLDLRDRMRQGEISAGSLEKRYVRKDGHVFWALLNVSLVRTASGEVIGSVGVAQDITELREAEARRLEYARQQRDTLEREVHHRIKNHLQGLAGLLCQHIYERPGLEPVLRKFAAQVNAISTVHGLQGRSPGGRTHLRGLVTEISAFLGKLFGVQLLLRQEPDQCFRVRPCNHGADCRLFIAEEESVPLALILNELLTNAVRHRHGPAPVSLDLRCDERGALIVLRNPGQLGAEFDFARGNGLGTGLGLVRSLMPRKGMTVSIAGTDGRWIETRIELTEPVLLPADRDPAQLVSLR